MKCIHQNCPTVKHDNFYVAVHKERNILLGVRNPNAYMPFALKEIHNHKFYSMNYTLSKSRHSESICFKRPPAQLVNTQHHPLLLIRYKETTKSNLPFQVESRW